jgi:hypothetical protein
MEINTRYNILTMCDMGRCFNLGTTCDMQIIKLSTHGLLSSPVTMIRIGDKKAVCNWRYKEHLHYKKWGQTKRAVAARKMTFFGFCQNLWHFLVFVRIKISCHAERLCLRLKFGIHVHLCTTQSTNCCMPRYLFLQKSGRFLKIDDVFFFWETAGWTAGILLEANTIIWHHFN